MSKEFESKRNNKIKLTVVATAFITTFMGSALNLSIPALENDFDVSASFIGWIVTVFTLSVASTSVPMGKIADIYGHRNVFLGGIAGFGIISLMCALASNIYVMIFFRVVQGLCAAMIFATNNSILMCSFPEERRGEVLGISTAATYIGLSVGPVIGGMLNYYLDWHSIFVFSFIISAVAFVLGYKYIELDRYENADKKCEKTHIDILGNFLYMISIICMLYGLSTINTYKYSFFITIVGVALVAVFIIYQKNNINPIIKVSMFTEDKGFAFSNIAALFNYGATFAISYLISIYLQTVKEMNSQNAGLLLILMPVIQAVFSPLMGKLSDRYCAEHIASCGMIICTGSLWVFSKINTQSSIAIILAGLFMAGFGFALFSSPNTNAIMRNVNRKDYGVANSIVATMRNFGQCASMAIVGIMTKAYIGESSFGEAEKYIILDAITGIFRVFIILSLIAVFISLIPRKKI